MVLRHETEDELTGYDERLLVGQTNLLARLDGVDGRLESGETHHGGQYGVDGAGLDDVVERLPTGIHLHVGVAEQGFEFLVVGLIGDDDRVGVELPRLLRQFLHAVVGSQTVGFEAVGVLRDDVERLRSDGAGAAEDAYLLFLHKLLVINPLRRRG